MNFKSIIFILIILMCMLSCQKENSFSSLKIKNPQLMIIWDSLFSSQSKSALEIGFIDIDKAMDTIEIEFSYLLKLFTIDERNTIINDIYGVYEYNDNVILIFGNSANLFFDKERREMNLDFLNIENMIDDENYIPIPYNPEIYTYIFQDGIIKFKSSNTNINP